MLAKFPFVFVPLNQLPGIAAKYRLKRNSKHNTQRNLTLVRQKKLCTLPELFKQPQTTFMLSYLRRAEEE